MNKDSIAIENFIEFCNEMSIDVTEESSIKAFESYTNYNSIIGNEYDIAEEGLATRILDKKFGFNKTITLYHGTNANLDIIKANSINMGNNLERRRKSSFWSNNLETAKIWALDWAAIKFDIPYVHDIDKNLFIIPDIINQKTNLPAIDYLKKDLESHPVYVYQATVPVKYVGRGQLAINEYTVNVNVKPEKKYIIYWTALKDLIKVAHSEEEWQNYVKKYNSHKKENLSWMETYIFSNGPSMMKTRKQSYDRLDALYKEPSKTLGRKADHMETVDLR